MWENDLFCLSEGGSGGEVQTPQRQDHLIYFSDYTSARPNRIAEKNENYCAFNHVKEYFDQPVLSLLT